MGLFGLVGGIIGSKKAKKYGKKAAKAQIAALQKGIDETSATYNETAQNYSPWIEGGAGGWAQLLDMIGVNGPEKQAVMMQGVQESPLFESTVRNGEEAVLQNASATGGVRGGNTIGSLADFRADAFTKVLMDQLSRLGGVAGFGANAVGQLGQFGAQKSQSIADMFSGQGQAKAGDYMNRGALAMNNWKNLGAFGDQVVSAAMGAGAGAGGAPFNFGQFAKSMF